MANAKISQLQAVTSVNGADLGVLVQGGTTSQTSIDDLFTDRTLVDPILGTPVSGALTNCTGLPLTTGVTGTLPVANGGTGITSFGAGVATFLGTPSSANLASAVTDETGSGALVFATSPSLTTPTLGVASATSVNKVAITAPATGSTLTIADGKTLTASNTLAFTGTDSSSVAFGTGGTVQYFITATAAALVDEANAINTAGKFAGKQVWDSTNNVPLWAAGVGANDVWIDGTGATVITPAP